MKTDSQVQKDALEELKWNPSVTHAHIGVAVAENMTVENSIRRIHRSSFQKGYQSLLNHYKK